MNYEKRKSFIVNVLYCIIIATIAFITIKYGIGMITPFLFAFLIAYFLKGPTRFISKKFKLPYKPIALLLVLLFYCTVGLLIVLGGIKIITSATSFIATVPKVYSNEIGPALYAFFNNIEELIFQMDPAMVTAVNDMFTQLVKSIGDLVTSLSVKGVSSLSSYATLLPGLFIELILMIISTFFIAGDYNTLSDFFSRQLSEKANKFMQRVKEYVVGTLFVCIRSYALIMTITFVELSIGLTILKVPNSVLIALIISIFDILPVLGTGGIMIPWVAITAIQGNYTLSIGLLIVYLIITVVRNVIEPKIVGSQIGLHPIVTLISMFVGAQVLGVIGLFGFPIFLSLLGHLNDTGTIKIFK